MAISRNMPSRKAIASYWFDRFEDIDVGIDPDGESCFACGDGLYLERAHIIPRANGGGDGADNLHILCAKCHLESEGLGDDLDLYWKWFNNKNLNHYHAHIFYTFQRMEARGFSVDAFTEITKTGNKQSAIDYLVAHAVPSFKEKLRQKVETIWDSSFGTGANQSPGDVLDWFIGEFSSKAIDCCSDYES